MAKGSQLTQLKSELSKAGISNQPSRNKKSKSSKPKDQDKAKKAAKLHEIHQKLNPFDVKVTKLKHDVGGRKIKGAVGHPAQSKQHGIEQRKKTLLKDFEERGRAGGIIDRRFGENDPNMSLEDRMLERFTRERQRASKGSLFNLEEEEDLTHYGQSLSKLDDFDNVGFPMDEDDDEEGPSGRIDKEVVQKTHFGGFEDEQSEEEEEQPDRKKSKAEVMAEVIAKSKEHKLRRQMEREAEENMRHELDQDFASLRSLLYAPNPSSAASIEGALETSIDQVKPLNDESGANFDKNYDQNVRELAFDQRAKAKDRTKTEEELALEAKEALEKAERQRLRRMMGEDAGESDEESNQRGKKRRRGGDDLDDDFADGDDLGILGTGLATEFNMEGGAEGGAGDEDEEDEEESNEDEGSDGDEEDKGDFEGEVDIDDEDGPEASEDGDFTEITTSRTSHKSLKKQDTDKSLPFTFPCPSSHEEFLEIVEEVDDDHLPTVVQRIRTLHHPSLAQDNKLKLQGLSGVLVDHILYVTSPPTPRLKTMNSLIPHLFSLSQSYPIQSAQYFNDKLALMHKNLKRGLSQGPTAPNTRTWPGLPELSLLRVIGLIWPTSDLAHPVISPARLLMGAYLGLCRVRSPSDLASGLFLCSLFLQYEAPSKRLIPEAVNFIINAILHLSPHPFEHVTDIPGSFPSPDFKSDLCLSLQLDRKKARKLAIQKPSLVELLTAEISEQMKVDLLGLALELLDKYAAKDKALDGFVELYEPLQTIVSGVSQEKLPESVKNHVISLNDTLSRLLKFSRQARQPLKLQAHKPIPIATYIPKFESHSSSYLRRQDPDHERNEAAKLRYQHKQERKGAIRELRKDARFLAAVENEKQKDKDKQYHDRMKRVFGSIEGERAEQKAMEREKSKEKRRAGRK
ncbi:Nop14-like protein [Coniophora puteana RWD-64-598 SS2]|uniref:Nop14-like protein n=1 Tax=Coniophora puteana (strain RWD-64-598) TaxID=741705 RepID=A0A5M3MAB2_CONPW|nr:Nop14-like protein [Coniophora puteana RWD-64-598 SS2]EIW76222.1 Nop14-like protein [Coniophora puteana RWD-64-598 SS2]